MQLTRTTIRLRPQIKKAAEIKAIELDITFQDLVEKAIEQLLVTLSHKKARQLVFKDRNIGATLDHLDREHIYAD